MLSPNLVAQLYDVHVLSAQSEPSARTRRAYYALVAAIASDGATCSIAYGRGGWRGTFNAEPYADLDAMMDGAHRARRDLLPFRVSDVNHNGAFLGNNSANLAFRAHHDAVHVDAALGFTFDDECRVAVRQGNSLGLPKDSDAFTVLFWEIVGQGAFHATTGDFPLTHDDLQPTVPVNDTTRRLAYALADEVQL